ncbi:tetratricopeptide repeat protein [Methylobacillus flagellatus]|uniref:tetratricopeptide repeat protein n=1 Tax=Methylobacillus flagellatus TaxID=405 RepID=UPI0010F9BECF|nr:tetratricopeptide repeat protein [Methylobacillus flagellatus]
MAIRKKLVLLIVAVSVPVFFLATFMQNWGASVAEKNLQDATALVPMIVQRTSSAKEYCPAIIKKLQVGLPELQQKKSTASVMRSYLLTADCQTAMARHSEAANSYAEMVKLEPQAARWHGQRASALLKAGRLSEAARASRLSVQLKPDDFRWRLQEARILSQIGRFDDAVHGYEQALKMAPLEQVSAVADEFNKLQQMLGNPPYDPHAEQHHGRL